MSAAVTEWNIERRTDKGSCFFYSLPSLLAKDVITLGSGPSTYEARTKMGSVPAKQVIEDLSPLIFEYPIGFCYPTPMNYVLTLKIYLLHSTANLARPKNLLDKEGGHLGRRYVKNIILQHVTHLNKASFHR